MATTSKPYDKALPFTRVNSPSEWLMPRALSGDGWARGTRRVTDFVRQSPLDRIGVEEVIKLTPSWTPTGEPPGFNPEQEVEGTLARSFQTWTDAPPFQWHRWYDWNFHLVPKAGFKWLRGFGNDATEPASDRTVSSAPVREQRVVSGATMECEWDTGAFAADDSPRPGPMFDADWAWPMTNQRVWVVGRSIYDGGHETAGLCRSELHPCKAIASARWEAFNFKENNGGEAGGNVFTPAIQFLFFSSRFGGYFDFRDLRPADGKPYEFIVDLPEAPESSAAHLAVGGTPDTAMNTVVLRSNQLLVDFDRKRFANTRNGSTAADVDPIVEMLPEDAAHPRLRQVKVTIPLAALTGDCYAVLISLGWRDLSGEQAARVKKCTVKMKNLFKASINHDTFAEEWRVRVGINGRWFQWEFTGVHNKSNHSLLKDQKGRPAEVVLHLDEQDAVQLSAHGAELNLVDDTYGEDRVIRVSNDDVNFENAPGDRPLARERTRRVADWNTQIDVRPPFTTAPGTHGSHPVQRAIARRITALMWDKINVGKLSADENSPLGLIDAVTTAPDREKSHNPLRVGPAVGLGERSLSLTGYHTWEEGHTAELVERPHRTNADATNGDWIDYRIDFSVKVENQ
jgi:hypothetical protein